MSAHDKANEARNMLKEGTLDIDAFIQEAQKEGYQVMPLNDLAEKFDTFSSDLGDVLSSDDSFISIESKRYDDYSDNEWRADEDDVREIIKETGEKAVNYASELDAMLIIDKNGDIAQLPFYEKPDGYYTEQQVETAIDKLIPSETTIIMYGRIRDYNYYEPPEQDEAEMTVDVEVGNFMAIIENAVQEDIAAFAQEDLSKLFDEKPHKPKFDRTDD